MDKKICLTGPAFEKLLEHMVKLEENKSKMIDEYFPEYGDERSGFIELFSYYLSEMDRIIKRIKISDDADDTFPFVVIGREVKIQDIDEDELFTYRLVSPFDRDITNGCVSFISPVGKALLFKRKGEDFSVKTPGGIYRYRIKHIRIGLF